MSTVVLPALVGTEPVGFLAALGVVRVLGHRGVDVRLAFDPTSAQAVLHGPASIDEVVDELVAAFEGMPEGQLMLGLPPGLPPAKQGTEGPDPSRMTRNQLSEVVRQFGTDQQARQWIRALWCDLVDGDQCAVTPFNAPTGQQTLRSMFQAPTLDVAKDPRTRLREAVLVWRRVDGVTGENLDVRAIRTAAEQQDGKATTAGVPGATWLALAAIPFFPMGGDGRRARTVCWFNLQPPGDRARPWFAWPVWRHAIDADAITVLLRHDVVREGARLAVERSDTNEAKRREERWRAQARALGVERVVVARRRQLPGGKSAGVLVPWTSMS